MSVEIDGHPSEVNVLALIEALKGLTDLITRTQNYCRMFLEPGEHRIQTERQLISAIIGLMDGLEQREAQKKAFSIIALFKKGKA